MSGFGRTLSRRVSVGGRFGKIFKNKKFLKGKNKKKRKREKKSKESISCSSFSWAVSAGYTMSSGDDVCPPMSIPRDLCLCVGGIGERRPPKNFALASTWEFVYF
jgi:hypothetical protein